MDIQLCPITWGKIETQIVLYRREFYLMWVVLRKFEVWVSLEWKDIYYKNLSYGRLVFDYIGKYLIQIPFFWVLLLACLFGCIFIYGILIVIIVDFLTKKRILWRWWLLLKKSNKIELNIK